MRIGMGTNLYDSEGYGRFGEGLYPLLKEHGFSCTDYNAMDTDSKLYTLPEAESDAMLIYEKELAQKNGITIWQVHGPWRWPAKDSTSEDRAERLLSMKKSIRMASVLGATYWVIHPIMPCGVEEIGTSDALKTWELNLEFMRELLKTAKELGVTICMENLPFAGFSMSRPEKVWEFVKEINDDNFKICIDTGHVSVFDDLDVGDVVKKFGDEIRVFHIHDSRYNQDAHLMPFMGVIDWENFASALKDIGFDGVFSFETMPPYGLPDFLFEKTSKLLCEYAQYITRDI